MTDGTDPVARPLATTHHRHSRLARRFPLASQFLFRFSIGLVFWIPSHQDRGWQTPPVVSAMSTRGRSCRRRSPPCSYCGRTTCPICVLLCASRHVVGNAAYALPLAMTLVIEVFVDPEDWSRKQSPMASMLLFILTRARACHGRHHRTTPPRPRRRDPRFRQGKGVTGDRLAVPDISIFTISHASDGWKFNISCDYCCDEQ